MLCGSLQLLKITRKILNHRNDPYKYYQFTFIDPSVIHLILITLSADNVANKLVFYAIRLITDYSDRLGVIKNCTTSIHAHYFYGKYILVYPHSTSITIRT